MSKRAKLLSRTCDWLWSSRRTYQAGRADLGWEVNSASGVGLRQLSNAWVALEAARAHTPLTLIGTTVLHQSHWSWSWASCTRCTHVSTITTWPTWNATRVPQPSGRQRRDNSVGTRQNLAANAARKAHPHRGTLTPPRPTHIGCWQPSWQNKGTQ